MKKLLFFTAVDNGYEDFLPLYIYFANKYNENSSFEFLVKNLKEDFLSLINNFSNQFGIKNVLLRNFNNEFFDANQYRFIDEPTIKCEYTYIGDVDIFIKENILPFHISKMNEHNTIYDNCIRPDQRKKLTGLHFIKTEEWYKQTKNVRHEFISLYSDKKCKINNEELLKLIADKSKVKLFDNGKFFPRPLHGVHISLKRKPFTDKMEFPSKEYKEMMIDNFFKTKDYEILKPFLSNNMLNILDKCNEYVINKNMTYLV